MVAVMVCMIKKSDSIIFQCDSGGGSGGGGVNKL